jgi:hypothetical protein
MEIYGQVAALTRTRRDESEVKYSLAASPDQPAGRYISNYNIN